MHLERQRDLPSGIETTHTELDPLDRLMSLVDFAPRPAATPEPPSILDAIADATAALVSAPAPVATPPVAPPAPRGRLNIKPSNRIITSSGRALRPSSDNSSMPERGRWIVCGTCYDPACPYGHWERA